MKIKKPKSSKIIKINSGHSKKKKVIKKKVPKNVIHYAHVNNAFASLILPRLKRFKYDHDRIIKPKPDIYINIKSNDDYYNLPNKIELNSSYQAALYKLDIETIDDNVDNHEIILNTINLNSDDLVYQQIIAELNDFNLNINDYQIINKLNPNTIVDLNNQYEIDKNNINKEIDILKMKNCKLKVNIILLEFILNLKDRHLMSVKLLQRLV